jgi:hypothetical protein
MEMTRSQRLQTRNLTQVSKRTGGEAPQYEQLHQPRRDPFSALAEPLPGALLLLQAEEAL